MSSRSTFVRRRDVLRAGAATGAALLAGGLLQPSTARAFGEAPPEGEGALVPEEHRVESVLEVFLFGGVSQHESLYVVPDHGAADNTGWHLPLSNGDLEQALQDCNFGGDMLLEIGADAENTKVYLGPFVEPLRARGDLLDRLRICVTSHVANPHEVAVPLGLTGRPLGHPNMAGIGAHIQRYFVERGEAQTLANAFVLTPSDQVVADLGRAAYATGAHLSTARPLPVFVDRAAALKDLLRRTTVGDAAANGYDALIEANIARFERRLRFKGAGEPLRARKFDALRAAARSMQNAAALEALLDPSLLEPVAAEVCGTMVATDTTTMSLRLAAHLISDPTAKARYVCVVDGGLVPTGEAGGYDTHEGNCPGQARNLLSVMQALSDVINAPGEDDPAKLSLDKTLVVINTEFGRSPYGTGADQRGRAHWPNAFPVVFLGGPITSSTPRVYGATNPDGNAKLSITPQDHRMAILSALGIWPFAPESYNVSDVANAVNEPEAALSVRQRVFGA